MMANMKRILGYLTQREQDALEHLNTTATTNPHPWLRHLAKIKMRELEQRAIDRDIEAHKARECDRDYQWHIDNPYESDFGRWG